MEMRGEGGGGRGKGRRGGGGGEWKERGNGTFYFASNAIRGSIMLALQHTSAKTR